MDGSLRFDKDQELDWEYIEDEIHQHDYNVWLDNLDEEWFTLAEDQQ